MVNHVRLEGLVGRVGPFGYTAHGMPMLAFQLCLHQRPCRPAQEADHLRVLLAAELAETWREALHVGDRLLVEGRLRPQTRRHHEVIASSVAPTLHLVYSDGGAVPTRRAASLG